MDSINLDLLLLWIVLLPMLGAAINGTVGRHAPRSTVHAVAVGSVATAFVLALISFVRLVALRSEVGDEGNPRLVYDAYEWFSIQVGTADVPVRVRFAMDGLSGVMTLIVTGIGTLIHIYSTGYMSDEPCYARFFAYLNLFMASMLILVLGSNLPLMFVGWEGVGLCSYLLIGFWFENSDYADAGRKAFVANRIGDFGVILGMFLLLAATNSFEFDEINASTALLEQPAQFGLEPLGISVAALAALFLFLGCAGKSAQIPLFVWLPDAMAGPTPVSALIHAATMVTAGVYLLCRLSPVFALAPEAMAVVAVIGALTAFLAATIGCVQNQIKRVLAYSTVSQLGFMVAAAGVGAFSAGFFHVFTHAFFKACLFLGAGSVMHAVGAHGDADVRELGGLRKFMPTTRWTFLVSCAAIAGFPLTSGFFSKDEILLGAVTVGHYFEFAPYLGWVVYGVLVVSAAMTAFYMFRLYFMCFSGDFRGGPAHGHDDHGHHDHDHSEPHESPTAMTFPLVVLGVGALVVGFLGAHLFHITLWGDWLAPSLGTIHEEAEHGGSAPWIAMAGGTSAFLVGFGLAYFWYFKAQGKPAAALGARFPSFHQLLMDKWRVDELYEATVLWANRKLALVSGAVDKVFVDWILTGLTASTVKALGFLTTRLQTGLVHLYGAVMVVGLSVMAWWFVVPHADLSASRQAGEVTYQAGRGFGYEYRFDFDSDGEFDTDWSPDPSAKFRFTPGSLSQGVAIHFLGTGIRGKSELKLQGGEVFYVPLDRLGNWRRPDGDGTPPYVAAAHGKLLVRPNGAQVFGRSGPLTEPFHLEAGESVRMGDAMLTAYGLVRGTVAVRNAFGYRSTEHVDVVIADPQANAGQAMVMVPSHGGTP